LLRERRREDVPDLRQSGKGVAPIAALEKGMQMPKEVHYFLFFREEIQQALLDYHALLDGDNRVGFAEALDLSEKGGAGVSARLLVREASGNAARELLFAPPDVLAATIQYCRSRRIPLARRSEKILRAIGDQLVLASVLNLRLTRPRPETRRTGLPGSPPGRSDQAPRAFGRHKSPIPFGKRAEMIE